MKDTTFAPERQLHGFIAKFDLCFLRGATLPDPSKVLLGSGKQTRFVRLPSAEAVAP
jgi:hypothetical protein